MVAADQFDSFEWVPTQLGAEAILFPVNSGRQHICRRDPQFSGSIPEETVYTHTGWTHLNGEPVYLHACGAIGAAGQVSNVRVEPPSSLKKFVLPEPPSGEVLAAAIRATLGLREVAPDHISVPLLCAPFRAVLGPCDLSVFIYGTSGTGKSELAARAQQFFGPEMVRTALPAGWQSTANALEAIAHAAKDAVLVVDDFVPRVTLQTSRGAIVMPTACSADREMALDAGGAGRTGRSSSRRRPAA